MRSLIIASAVGYALVATSGLSAQGNDAQTSTEPKPTWGFIVSSGVVVPTGVQRSALERGKVTAAQLSYMVRPAVALTATLGWARTHDVATVDNARLDVFSYDVGAELRAPRWLERSAINFMPFAGLGLGGRSYNYRSLDVDATHNGAAYGSVGGELGVRRVRLRIEARDYVSGFKSLSGDGASRTGNDVVVMAGLRFVRR